MPYLELSPDFRLFYKIDDYTDPWAHPETVLFVHGFTENTEATGPDRHAPCMWCWRI